MTNRNTWCIAGVEKGHHDMTWRYLGASLLEFPMLEEWCGNLEQGLAWPESQQRSLVTRGPNKAERNNNMHTCSDTGKAESQMSL
eukprot:5430153-Amphidinium_carterae.1